MKEIIHVQNQKRKGKCELQKQKLKRIKYEDCITLLNHNIERICLSMSTCYETSSVALCLKSSSLKNVVDIHSERNILIKPDAHETSSEALCLRSSSLKNVDIHSEGNISIKLDDCAFLNGQIYHNIESPISGNYYGIETLFSCTQIVNANMDLAVKEYNFMKLIKGKLAACKTLLLIDDDALTVEDDIFEQQQQQHKSLALSDKTYITKIKGNRKNCEECRAIGCSRYRKKISSSYLNLTSFVNLLNDQNIGNNSLFSNSSILMSLFTYFKNLKTLADFSYGYKDSDKCLESEDNYLKSISFREDATVRNTEKIKFNSFSFDTLLENIEINKSVNFTVGMRRSNLKRKYCRTSANYCDSLNLEPGETAIPTYLSFKKFKWEAKAIERSYNIQFSERNSRNCKIEARQAVVEYYTTSEIKNSKQISKIFAQSAVDKNREDETKFLPDELERTIINANCYFEKNGKESSREISILALGGNISESANENFVSLLQESKPALDSFYDKKIKSVLPWKRRCGAHPLIASVRNVKENATLVCSEMEEQCSNIINTGEMYLNNSKQAHQRNCEKEDSFMNDGSGSIGEIFMLNIDKNLKDKSWTCKDKLQRSVETVIAEEPGDVLIEDKKDIGCQTEISPCSLPASTELPEHFTYQTKQDTECKQDSIMTDTEMRHERPWNVTGSMICDEYNSEVNYEELSAELDEGSNDLVDSTRQNDHLVPSDEVVPSFGKSKVRVGLSRQLKAKPLHPYLRCRSNWYF